VHKNATTLLTEIPRAAHGPALKYAWYTGSTQRHTQPAGPCGLTTKSDLILLSRDLPHIAIQLKQQTVKVKYNTAVWMLHSNNFYRPNIRYKHSNLPIGQFKIRRSVLQWKHNQFQWWIRTDEYRLSFWGVKFCLVTDRYTFS
jgi:hypothetical protein